MSMSHVMKSWKEIAVPPDRTRSGYSFLRVQTSHFMALWKEMFVLQCKRHTS